jgi:hypothetical protein
VTKPTAGGRTKNIDSIVERVQAEIPSMTKEAILLKIDVVRKKNNGTIGNLTMAKLVEQIRMLHHEGQVLRSVF